MKIDINIEAMRMETTQLRSELNKTVEKIHHHNIVCRHEFRLIIEKSNDPIVIEVFSDMCNLLDKRIKQNE